MRFGTKSKLSAVFIAIVLMALALPWPIGRDDRYDVIDLGALPGDVSSTAKDINDYEQIVGYSYNGAGEFRGFLWEDGIMTDLGTLGGTYTRAYGINNSGRVAGYSYNENGYSRAFLWENGVMTDLGTLGGVWSAAYDINELGEVAGYSYDSEGKYHAFIWKDGVMTDLGTLGGDNSVAFVINNKGDVSGRTEIPAGTFHAFGSEKKVQSCRQCPVTPDLIDLGTLGGENSDGWDMNDAGQVIGWSDTGTGEYHAFFWDAGHMFDLGTMDGPNSEARGINDHGHAVGNGFDDLEEPRAFLWEGEDLIDLNDLAPPAFDRVLAFANAINDAGQIVGSATDGENLHAFFMFPRHDPALSSGSVSPLSGYHGTLFEYRVNFFDADDDAPAVIQVHIDGTPYDMTLESGSASDGTYLFATREMLNGFTHGYYFYGETDEGIGSRFPVEGTMSGPVMLEPEIFLSGTPASGGVMTAEVWGVVDGMWFVAWSSEPGPYDDPISGLTLDIGPGDLQIVKDINEDPVFLDHYGYGVIDFLLPFGVPSGTKYIQATTRRESCWAKTNRETFEIPHYDPILSDGAVSPENGFYSTLFKYTVNYYDPDGDTPAMIHVCIDGTEYAMTLASGMASDGMYKYATRDMSLGDAHEFYFYAEDVSGGGSRFPLSGVLSGPACIGPQLSISGTPGPGALMTVEIWGVADGMWLAAWSSEPGPFHVPAIGLTFDIGPGDIHTAKGISEDPLFTDEYGFGVKDFQLPSELVVPGTKYVQGATKKGSLWAKTSRDEFIVP